MRFRINLCLLEQSFILQWSKNWTSQYRSKIDNLLRSIIKYYLQCKRSNDFKINDSINSMLHALPPF